MSIKINISMFVIFCVVFVLCSLLIGLCYTLYSIFTDKDDEETNKTNTTNETMKGGNISDIYGADDIKNTTSITNNIITNNVGDIDNKIVNNITNNNIDNKIINNIDYNKIPKRFPQVSTLTNSVLKKYPLSEFVVLDKTDGLHINMAIIGNIIYSIKRDGLHKILTFNLSTNVNNNNNYSNDLDVNNIYKDRKSVV